MQRYIDSDRVNAALDRIREEVWLHDIPSPTVPEYIEHHDAIQQIMLVIDKERKLLSDAADVAPVRHGKWITRGEFIDCSLCLHEKWSRVPYEELVRRFRYCPNCGARMDGGDGE